MLLPLRSRNMFQPLPRVCCGLLSALLVLAAPAVEAAPSKKASKSSRTGTSKAGASKTSPASQPAASTPEPSPPAEETKAAPAPAEAAKAAEEPARLAVESKPAAESKAAAAPRPAPVVRSAPVVRAAAAPEPTASIFPGRVRIGVGPDLFFESSRMSGELGIDTSRRDESFDYSSAGFLSVTAWLNSSVPSVSERLRVGAGLRVFGNYAAGGDREFGFGLLNEVFATGEYGLPVADKMEVVFAARAGLSFLIPGREFSAEIRRLQEQGVSVWSVPRVGWLVGPSVGARRRMSERIWLRADVLGQVEQQYLFATSQEISGFNYTKNWSTLALRLGLSLGAEFSL
ncbi:hypothetical protein [Vitiosangium sp. GDMCC 1.1324]|uniref:hypothetical protein n=1 Tax=Vitiosangium sp. (strain GDMCC 1.1324) TaxID=2138576 RepID=UPI000D391F3A|nr:hypothetical protein [Vitiosangium sp. GDMCC 1.1324]PTL81933.1 hypothetical protein DAT35_19125 [Vitiosangium sp. GDMCC 1.1324]